jgi:hypothetical protein
MLNEQEITSYQQNGYIVPSDFHLAPDETNALRADLEKVPKQNPDIPSERLINPHLDGKLPYGGIGVAGFDRLARDTHILDIVEQVIGSDLILWLTHLFCKPVGTGREVPWHQDSQYWPIEPAATCTVWLALDKVDQENCVMRVIPGAHKNSTYSHSTDLSPKLTLN